jgi:hypothetical protein
MFSYIRTCFDHVGSSSLINCCSVLNILWHARRVSLKGCSLITEMDSSKILKLYVVFSSLYFSLASCLCYGCYVSVFWMFVV